MPPTEPPLATPVIRGESDLLVFISSVMTDELQWARDVAEATFRALPIVRPWTFEHTPASSESATATYLRKVEEADFVLWLVGAQTTLPVVDEVHACITHDRRLLVFKLPAENRDELTRRLLDEVSPLVKWRNVTNRDLLAAELTASISDQLVLALRDPAPPARRQRLRAWRALSAATCKRSWISLGVPDEVATELAADQTIGDFLAPSETRLRMLVGDVGTGKSLAASRLFQHAIDRALQDATQPLPLFFDARHLGEPLHEGIDKRSVGIVRAFQQPILVILDGLDEVGVSRANELLAQAHSYVDANPQSAAVVTTKPLPGLRIIDNPIRIPPLSDAAALSLISRIAGHNVGLGQMYGWPDSVRDAAKNPLFAIMIGSELRHRPDLHIIRPVQLIERLAQQIARTKHLEGERINTLLQELAVRLLSTRAACF